MVKSIIEVQALKENSFELNSRNFAFRMAQMIGSWTQRKEIQQNPTAESPLSSSHENHHV